MFFERFAWQAVFSRPFFQNFIRNLWQNAFPVVVGSRGGNIRSFTAGAERELSEQDSTTVPKSAYLRFCPFGKSCWGVPSPNPAMRLVPLENPTKNT